MNTFSKMLYTILLSVSAASVFAEPQSYLALDNGYRWDRIRNRVSMGGGTISVKSSSQVLKHINSYQLGARGQWTFCKNTFVRANGHYGWTWDGRYRESAIDGHAKGNTWDVDGAIGYYFCAYRKTNLDAMPQNEVKEKTIAGCWIAPVLGWSYYEFDMKGTHLKMPLDGVVYDDLSHIDARQTFNGPYAGFDMLFQLIERLDFLFSYEFHYTDWHGKREIEGDEYGNPWFGWTTGFSNKRHIDNVIGQVFKLNISYNFFDRLRVGLELKDQYFAGDHGKYKQTKRPIIPAFSFAKVDGLWWHSFGATIYIGGAF